MNQQRMDVEKASILSVSDDFIHLTREKVWFARESAFQAPWRMTRAITAASDVPADQQTTACILPVFFRRV